MGLKLHPLISACAGEPDFIRFGRNHYANELVLSGEKLQSPEHPSTCVKALDSQWSGANK
jgi:hypothetical protein